VETAEPVWSNGENPRYRRDMVLFPLAIVWLVVVLVWVLRNSRNDLPEERVWQRFRPRPRRDGDPPRSGRRANRRASATGR
jgi:hypothetical protein